MSFPRLSRTVDWEASYFLNALCNRLNFILIITSRTAAGAIHAKESRRIYASPHAVRMEVAGEKSEETSHSFPTVSFQLHDHWGHTTITADRGSMLGVELAVKGDLLGRAVKCYVFRGALSFPKIAEEYARVSASKWVWARADEHMVKMRGPGGRGEAIMAVKREQATLEAPSAPPVSTLAALRSWIPFRAASPPSDPASLSYVCVVSSISLDWREIVDRITKESEN